MLLLSKGSALGEPYFWVLLAAEIRSESLDSGCMAYSGEQQEGQESELQGEDNREMRH